MQIEITTAFVDRQATNPEDADVPVGKKLTVTAERGAELIGLGLAVDRSPPARTPAATKRAAPATRKKPATKAAPQSIPAPTPNPDTAQAATPATDAVDTTADA